jgi:Holliday junction resolvase RusA-like endonuclease
VITLEIPRVPSSPNMLRSKHWRVRYRETKLWREEIGYAVLQIKPSLAPIPKAKVAIERRSKGIMDTDNLYGCVKPVIDGLRHAGVLVDDSPDHIELTVTQSRGTPLTRIQIQPV